MKRLLLALAMFASSAAMADKCYLVDKVTDDSKSEQPYFGYIDSAEIDLTKSPATAKSGFFSVSIEFDADSHQLTYQFNQIAQSGAALEKKTVSAESMMDAAVQSLSSDVVLLAQDPTLTGTPQPSYRARASIECIPTLDPNVQASRN